MFWLSTVVFVFSLCCFLGLPHFRVSVVVVDQKPLHSHCEVLLSGGCGGVGTPKEKVWAGGVVGWVGRGFVGMTVGKSTHKIPWWGPSGRLPQTASSLRGRSCLRPSSSCGTPGGG